MNGNWHFRTTLNSGEFSVVCTPFLIACQTKRLSLRGMYATIDGVKVSGNLAMSAIVKWSKWLFLSYLKVIVSLSDGFQVSPYTWTPRNPVQ